MATDVNFKGNAMRSTILPTVAAMCVALWAVASPAAVRASEPAHGHDGHATVKTLNPGEKWPTDDVLRQGMDSIRVAVAARQQDIDAGRLDAQGYQRLADVVDQNTATIVKNCKLSKDADTAFHSTVLSPLLADSQLMRSSPKIEVKRVAAMGVAQTLRNYGQYFQHPGWSVPTGKAP